MSSSEELGKRRAAAVSKGVSSLMTSYVEQAGGGTLTDVDGREWIDFGSGIAVTSVGNAAPREVERRRRAGEAGPHDHHVRSQRARHRTRRFSRHARAAGRAAASGELNGLDGILDGREANDASGRCHRLERFGNPELSAGGPLNLA